MEDLTLTSDIYNNLKFNMQKLICDEPEIGADRLSRIFNATLEICQKMLGEFEKTVEQQAESLKTEFGVPEVKRELTVAFVGDSITSDRESYLNIIKRMYREKPKLKIVDAAVSGDKSDDAVMKFYLRALNHKPDVVHILIGTNDLRKNNDRCGKPCVSLEEYESNLNYMLDILKQGGTHVVISTISPVNVAHLNLRFPEDNWTYAQSDIDRCNEIIAETAGKYHAKLNDMRTVFSAFRPEEILLQDGLHLNRRGQHLLAHNVLEAIKEYF
jgi:lysophospholipase L1-like esterase